MPREPPELDEPHHNAAREFSGVLTVAHKRKGNQIEFASPMQGTNFNGVLSIAKEVALKHSTRDLRVSAKARVKNFQFSGIYFQRTNNKPQATS